MIAIIPEQVAQWRPVTPALRRLFQRIKRLPFDNARAWVSFPRGNGEPPAPDFLILDGNNRAFLLSAGMLTQSTAEEILQPGLFDRSETSQTETETLRVAAAGLANFFESDAVTRCLIIPGLTQRQVTQLSNRLDLPRNVLAAGEPESLADWLSEHALAPLEIDASHALQAAFNVESQIPAAFVPRIRTQVRYGRTAVDPRETTYLLDFNQEAWVKNDLLPSDETLQAIEGTTARLITGVAGSGKSLALLYRARLQATCSQPGNTAERSHRKTLFVTHNKPLIGDLKWRFGRLLAMQVNGEAQQQTTEFVHFFRWCGNLHFQNKLELIKRHDRLTRIAQLSKEAFPDSGLPDTFFVDEIGFLADQIDDSERAYLETDRTGRGIALDKTQRQRMHAVYSRYRASLAVNRETDWPFIVRIVWDKIRANSITLPRYDSIFVDEAQFFAPVWFAILKACLHPASGEFVVAADPTQGFLKRRLSWRSVGLNVVGRAARLKKSYRNTPAIQNFARRFYDSRILSSEHLAEETILPTEGNRSEEEAKDTPRLIKHRAIQDAILWTANEIAASLKAGLSPGSILVLIEDRGDLDALQITLNEKLGRLNVHPLSYEVPTGNTVALATLNAATGIERPVVFLLGLDALFEREGDPRLDDRQRVEMIRDHTRKIYMALTRAGEKLLISYRHDRTRALLEATPDTERASPTDRSSRPDFDSY